MLISSALPHKIENERKIKAGEGLLVNEKQMEIVEQYDLEVKESYRSRGCLHLRTDQGLVAVMPYNGSPLRLACELELQQRLEQEGMKELDRIFPNKEESFITYDKYRSPYIVKRAFEGRECSLKEEKDVEAACQNLARLHRILQKFTDYHVEKRDSLAIPVMLQARMLELKRIRNFIKKSGRRTAFELTFTSSYESFFEEAKEAAKWAKQQPEQLWNHGFGICHGSYHQHNILVTPEGIATLNLGQFHYNQQILDLYTLMRKALEKNQYQRRIFEAAVRGYETERKLEAEDHQILFLLFSFPEKFWKISNQYYNSKKCWMPPKNLEKLKKTMEQNESRRRFLANLDFSL